MANRLKLLRETVAVYCDNRTEHTNTLCGQHADSHENLISRKITCAKRRRTKQQSSEGKRSREKLKDKMSHEFLFA
jgi:hypothetical protein